MKGDSLYIFVHLHKTGGTTLNKHIEKNYKKNEVLFLYHDKLKLDPFTSKKQNYKKLTEKAVLQLSKKQRKKIKVISGHFLPMGIHGYFGENRRVRYITIIRNPFQQAQSFYNYFMTLYSKEDQKGKNKILYKYFLKINEKIPDFETWLDKKFGDIKGSVVPQPLEKYFSSLGYKLSDFYFIGITERLNKDLPFIFHLLGIKKYFVNQNISENFIKGDSTQLQKRFEKKYEKSINLYKRALSLNSKFKKNHTNFNKIVKRVVIRRKILTPITQITFDFVESLRILSSYFRKKSKLYGKTLDLVKKRWAILKQLL